MSTIKTIFSFAPIKVLVVNYVNVVLYAFVKRLLLVRPGNHVGRHCSEYAVVLTFILVLFAFAVWAANFF